MFEGDCLDLGRTNSPTSARHGDGLVYITIWATPPRRLVFWDGAPSPYRNHLLGDQDLVLRCLEAILPKLM